MVTVTEGVMKCCSLSQSLAEFDLRSVKYEITSTRCHELRLTKPPHDCLTFTFRSEQEAQEWATVMMSSLRESHRGQSSQQHIYIYKQI